MTTLYEYDILNRHASHTLTYLNGNDLVRWELKDGSSNLIMSTRGMSGDDVGILKKMRRDLGFGDDVLPVITTTQRDVMTPTPQDGQMIANLTTSTMQTRIGGSWV